MDGLRSLAEEYRSLGLLLLIVAAMAATIVASCGGGGGSSNGGLCEQCGDTDGPCQATGFVVPGATEPTPCPTDVGNPNPCVEVALICRRKADSAQQRCYPVGSDPANPDFFFKCDGDPPGGTAVPEPTRTLTPTPETTPTCGNGIREGSEECDESDFDDKTCATDCAGGLGSLTCNLDCTLNCSLCTL